MSSNMIVCLDCGKEISKRAKTCVHCGAPVPQETRKVIIERKKEFVGSGIAPTVYIDDKLIGVMKVGSKFEVDVELGEHNLILDYQVENTALPTNLQNAMTVTSVSNKKKVENIKITEKTNVLKITFEKGLKMKITEVTDDYQINEIEDKKVEVVETVELMEVAPANEIVEIMEVDEEKEEMKREKNQLKKEKDDLVDKNDKLNDDIEKLSLENKRLKEQEQRLNQLALENETLKENNKMLEQVSSENEELSNKLSNLEKEKSKLVKDLKVIKDNKKEKNIEKSKKLIKQGYTGTKKLVVVIINAIRYLFGLFLLLGSIVCLLSSEFKEFLFFFSTSITIMPLLYKFLWKLIGGSDKKKILIQIIIPIVIFFISALFMVFG